MLIVVVSLVGTQLSWFASTRPVPGLDRRDRGDNGQQQGAVMGIRSGNIHDQRNSIRIGQDMNLRSPLAAIDRAGPSQRSPLFRPDARRVQDRRRPIEFTGTTETVENRTMQLLEHPGPGPCGEPAVRSRYRHPERGRQVPPGTPARQHEDDRGEGYAIVDRCTATAL